MSVDRPKAITLKDVARSAGISVNAASRALRDMPDIGEETKKRVRHIARELGYRKNLSAVRLKTKRSLQIGLVVNDVANPFMSFLLRGVERVCIEHGYSVLLSDAAHKEKAEDDRIRKFIEIGVDGLLFVPVDRSRDGYLRLLKALEQSTVPYIVTAAYLPGVESSYVACDDELGGYLAAEHLYGLGHRHFSLLFGNLNTSPMRDRRRGFEKYLAEVGLDPASHIACCTPPEGGDDMREAVKVLLSTLDKSTAVFCYCDNDAMDLYAALYPLGIRIPRDLSVVGYDDIRFAECLYPPLTTVHLGPEMLGEIATRELLTMIKSPYENVQVKRQIVIRPHLVLRGSTAPPREGAIPYKEV